MSAYQDCPLDLKPQWLSVARRMQSVSKTGGLALVSITVLVDVEGIPRLWMEPSCKKIEPRRASQDILNLLSTLMNDDAKKGND